MIGLLVDAISPLLAKVIPDLDKRAELAQELATMTERHAQELAQGQLEVNKVEAAHKSLFVAGWRPAVGWVCVAALGFNYLVVPMAVAYGAEVVPVDDSNMMTVLLGMLGLGGLRTFEKHSGVARLN